ncbi:MAG: cytochrome c oxidase assembly protein [Alphaproteobacteria bacterium]|nr:cytochrome c oxidase assembly protein [Alphaproteobacteria bacterium]|tara:strand:- start:16200 stop:16808 length:609 start_codon:yes stop_codon:yes gene_type:complete
MLEARRKKLITFAALSLIVLTMGGLVAVAQPLYELFCQVTGYGGTTKIVDEESISIGKREIMVQFNADVAENLPWRFKPDQREIKLRIGENKLAFYSATNLSSRPFLGSAIFNVTPQKAGKYFSKIDCFCFEEQLLMPGQTQEMPVNFFIDPEIDNDTNLNEVRTITLSYTFFDLGSEDLQMFLNENDIKLTNREDVIQVIN